MKMIKLFFVLTCLLMTAVSSFGQTYVYSPNSGDLYIKDNAGKVAEEYVKNKYVPKGWKYYRESSAIYTLPNKNKLVVIKATISYTEKQTLYSTNGNGFYTNNGWSDHVNKLKENKEPIYYAVVIKSDGSPSRAIRVCERFVLNISNNNNFVILASNPSGTKYTNALGFDYDANELWALRSKDQSYGKYEFHFDKLCLMGISNNQYIYKLVDLRTGTILEDDSFTNLGRSFNSYFQKAQEIANKNGSSSEIYKYLKIADEKLYFINSYLPYLENKELLEDEVKSLRVTIDSWLKELGYKN